MKALPMEQPDLVQSTVPGCPIGPRVDKLSNRNKTTQNRRRAHRTSTRHDCSATSTLCLAPCSWAGGLPGEVGGGVVGWGVGDTQHTCSRQAGGSPRGLTPPTLEHACACQGRSARPSWTSGPKTPITLQKT